MKPRKKPTEPDDLRPSEAAPETPPSDTFALERDALAASMHGRHRAPSADAPPEGDPPPNDGRPHR